MGDEGGDQSDLSEFGPQQGIGGKRPPSGTPASICERVVGWERLEEQAHLSPSHGETKRG